jgi:branched-chain amino acid transport system ATP-binding protein
MLELSGVNVHYGKIHVLRDVTLRVETGEVAALIGPNAAGKTTTLRALVGLKDCTSGVIRFGTQPIQRLSTPDRVRLGIALVPEGRQVFPKFSVLDNLRLGAFHRADRDRLDADFETVFAIFPKLAERRHQKAGLMSGGEQQMLAIARALMARPRLVLFDEPSLGLAPTIVETTFGIIADIRRRGTTVLMVEQNAYAALRMADRAYVMETGRIVLEGAARDLLHDDHVRRAYLGG